MAADNARSHHPAEPAPAPPLPAPHFGWRASAAGPLLESTVLATVAQHAFTTRQLALPASAAPDVARAAWTKVASALDVALASVWRVRQVHGRAVRVVRSGDAVPPDAPLPDGDAVITNVAGSAVGVMVADCVPVLLADRGGRAVAAVHAGWRGTCAGIATATVEALGHEFGVEPGQLVAAIGPSIGSDDYEVGEAVRDAFVAAGHPPADIARWFGAAEPGAPWHLDLWTANRDQLVAAGLEPKSVHVAGLSTWAHPAWLESFRRDGAAAGRMIAMIRMPVGA